MINKKKSLVIVLVIIIGLLITGCSNHKHSVQQAYSVSGTVTNFDEEGLPDVSLSFTNANGTATTNSNGNWSKSSLKSSGTIKAAKENYYFVPSKITVKSSSKNIDFVGVGTISNAIKALGSTYDIVTVGGIVTYKEEDNHNKTNLYIQEINTDNPGIMVRIPGYDLNIFSGDEIIAKGKSIEFHGMNQIEVYTASEVKVIKEDSKIPEPLVVNTIDLSTNGDTYEGKLVKIKNVTLDYINKYNDGIIKDADGSVKIELDNTSKGWLQVGVTYDYIIGVVHYEYNEHKILPRKRSDIAGLDGDIVQIHHIQGNSHVSPYLDKKVEVDGVVTAIDKYGFYMQELEPDNDPATSEGLYIFMDDSPIKASLRSVDHHEVAIGNHVTVQGKVIEYMIDHTGHFYVNQERQLRRTAIKQTAVLINKHGVELPEPIVLGIDRLIPDQVDDDEFSSFDYNEDAIDFYESLEGMLVQIDDALVVGPTNYGITPVVPNNGAGISNLTDHNGLYISEDTLNPERIFIEGSTLNKIDVNGDGFVDSYDQGTIFNESIIGILSYDEGKYMVYNTKSYDQGYFTLPYNNREQASFEGDEHTLTVATYNIKNFTAKKPKRASGIAKSIVEHLNNPDIIGLQEVADNNGNKKGIVAADQSYQILIEEILAAGGPEYKYLNIDPENNADGGAPDLNIRVGILYNPNRVDFTFKGTPDATTPTLVEDNNGTPNLSLNPGRVYPNDMAFFNSRKPLAAEFTFNGEKVFVIVNHFCSKSGDDPLFGNQQPPINYSENDRILQAAVVNYFVNRILSIDPNANVIVMGDLNDFEFSEAVNALEGNRLNNLMKDIPQSKRYTYNYEGNSQVLDHILVSDNLYLNSYAEAVTINSIYAKYGPIDIFSDHDPVVAGIDFE